MPESYQPGRRGPNKNKYDGKISANRFAWVVMANLNYTILVGDEDATEVGTDVVLFRPMPGRVPSHSLNLTNLTEPELDALEQLFKDAFEWARPVVQRRDKEARDAWDQGDDSHVRNYRAAPTVVYRKRPVSQHGEGVFDGSEGVPSSGRSDGDLDDGVPGTSPGMAEPDEGLGVTEYDGEANDES